MKLLESMLDGTVQSPRPDPLIRITKAGANVYGSAEDFTRLRVNFEKDHCMILPGFLDSRLLDLIERKLSESDYRVVDRETGVELRPVDCTAYLAAELL